MSPMRPRFAVLCGGAAAPASPPALPARGRLRALPAAADLDLDIVVTYRAQEAERIGKHGRKLRPHSMLDSHKALFTFLRWARTRTYEFDPSILELKRLRVPKPEADVYHMSQLRTLPSRCRRRLSRLGGPSGGLGGGATAWGRARSPAGQVVLVGDIRQLGKWTSLTLPMSRTAPAGTSRLTIHAQA